MKKLLCCLVLAALITGVFVSFTEGVAFEPVLQYMPALTAVKGTNYVIATEKYDRTRSVYDTSGNLLAAFPNAQISWANFDFFIVWDEDDGKSLALADVSGELLTDYAYGDFKALSRHWVLGYVLEPNEEGSHKRNKVGYDIVKYDVLYFGDERVKGEPVASVDGSNLIASAAHGDYIAIQGADNVIHLYDREFKEYEFAGARVNSAIFNVRDYTIFNYITGEMIAEGYTAVKELADGGETYLLASQTDFQGNTVNSIIDLSGNELMPAGYFVDTFSGDYAVVSNDEGLKGLYSVTRGELIVPCEFYDLPASAVSTDKYVHNGYVVVDNGSLRGYYDIVSKQVSVEPKLEVENVTTVGCVSYQSREEGVYTLYAADGEVNEVYVDSINESLSRGDGYLLVAVRNNMYGVIDWHGNEVLPFVHVKAITITDDSAAILRTGTGVQMDKVIR